MGFSEYAVKVAPLNAEVAIPGLKTVGVKGKVFNVSDNALRCLWGKVLQHAGGKISADDVRIGPFFSELLTGITGTTTCVENAGRFFCVGYGSDEMLSCLALYGGCTVVTWRGLIEIETDTLRVGGKAEMLQVVYKSSALTEEGCMSCLGVAAQMALRVLMMEPFCCRNRINGVCFTVD